MFKKIFGDINEEKKSLGILLCSSSSYFKSKFIFEALSFFLMIHRFGQTESFDKIAVSQNTQKMKAADVQSCHLRIN